jgi:hypothetical protein
MCLHPILEKAGAQNKARIARLVAGIEEMLKATDV